MDPISAFFDTILVQPLTNLFVLLTTLTGNAGIGVILLTIIIRVVTLPMTLKQMHSMRMMGVLAPRLADVKKRYKDPRRQQQETMRLYREAGINPLGCFSSMLIQLPILFALYRTFLIAVGEAPEAAIKLRERLYPVDYLQSNLPLPADFLWLHLGRPDSLVIIPILVAITTYTLQKMTTMPAADERARAQASMMNMLMPFIFGYITLTLPSGLGLYYVLSNVIGMVLQYAYVGGGALNWRALVGLSQEPVLPRAMEVRQRNLDSVSQIAEDQDDEPANGSSQPAKPRGPKGSKPSTGDGAAAVRRRYAGGRRRSRR